MAGQDPRRAGRATRAAPGRRAAAGGGGAGGRPGVSPAAVREAGPHATAGGPVIIGVGSGVRAEARVDASRGGAWTRSVGAARSTADNLAGPVRAEGGSGAHRIHAGGASRGPAWRDGAEEPPAPV